MSFSQQIELSAQALPQHYGARLDQVVAELFSEYSRSRLKNWILEGLVTLDGEICTVPKTKLSGDEVIEISAELTQEVNHQAQSIPLDVVFEDESILVINKPTDMVVHPGAGNAEGTVLNAVLAHAPEVESVPRAGIVHRLDKDTTGLMVIAKTLNAQSNLVDQLQRRSMGREYEAICYGTLVAGATIDEPIGRHPAKRTLMAVRESGKPAVTHFRVIEKFRSSTHVRLRLESGRTHQIRVHMAHIKHPLIGDVNYGGRTRLPKAADDALIQTLRGFKRQALHAIQLQLKHPESKELVTFTRPPPDDFNHLLYELREDTHIHGFDD